MAKLKLKYHKVKKKYMLTLNPIIPACDANISKPIKLESNLNSVFIKRKLFILINSNDCGLFRFCGTPKP